MNWINEAWEKAISKVTKSSERIQDVFPYIIANGHKYSDKSDDPGWWTNGFWPGLLWIVYQATKDGKFRTYAEGVEKKLDNVLIDYDRVDHDAGFMWHLSSVTNFRLTGNDRSRRRGLLAASIMASRYNLKGGFIRAWHDIEGQPSRAGWAIIDCMMNLPLLYWASEMSEDPRFRFIAQSHADTTMREFIRPDGSVKHIVSFDPETGEMLDWFGGQGYDKNSSWSRGTAWALYGFTLSYQYTGEQSYLDTAKKVANFFTASLPDDYVPFADFKAPEDTNIHKDTSAAACAASGLLLLSSLVSENEKHTYKNAALKILKSLYENYCCWDENYEALLKHGCVAYHFENETDVSLIYADYFFMEALAQLKGIKSLFSKY